MRVAYRANIPYRPHSPAGGFAHIRQFISNAAALGHQVWLWSGGHHPDAEPVPPGRLARMRLLRHMDVLYYRVEFKPPRAAHLALPPFRQAIGSPLVVWEFNTVPSFARVLGEPEERVREYERGLRHFGRGCDLAVCVSQSITDYVQRELRIRRAITVANGSDPDLFRPDVPPVPRLATKCHRGADGQRLNVVWIGSGDLSWHNFHLLREAAWSLFRQGHAERIAFHVIGPGITELRDAPPNVYYHGPESYELLPGWLSAMDVGLCLYRPGAADFSSPLKVFDYMASGLAVVSTPQPQVQVIFQKLGQGELFVPPAEPEALAALLLQLAADRKRVAEIGAAGRKLVVEYYNWRRAARETFEEIEARVREDRVR